jgi:hypothetical protein
MAAAQKYSAETHLMRLTNEPDRVRFNLRTLLQSCLFLQRPSSEPDESNLKPCTKFP